MESTKKDWKQEARDCFFESHMSIEDISSYIGISRQSISGYLKTLPGYKEEKERRKIVKRENRKEYKREKNREYRASYGGGITAETIRREHDVAALILSREKYH